MISAIRNYLIKDTELMGLLNNQPSIYFVVNTKKDEDKETEYIIYNYKIVSGGYVKRYQLTMQFIGKDITKLLQIQDRTEYLLDNFRHNKFIIDGNNQIRSIELLNGGGQIYDEETKNYTLVSYFLFKI